MRTRLAVHLLFLASAAAFSGVPRITVGYATFSAQLSAEDSAAIDWLQHHGSFTVDIAHLEAAEASVPRCDLLWIHIPDSTGYRQCLARESQHHALTRYAGAGGTTLCTDYAAFLPNDLGLESTRPCIRFDTLQNDWLWDKKGFQSFRGHPLFAGLFGGEYVWDARVDQVLPIIGYYGQVWPTESAVLAVEKSYVFMHPDRKTVVECRRNTARTLSIGGEIYFARANTLRRNMERFVDNALRYLAGSNTSGPATVWKPSDGIPRPFSVDSPPLRQSGGRTLSKLTESGLILKRGNPRNDFFDAAGRRTLIMGRENGGIDEVWIHPIRVLRDYQVGIVSGDSVSWLQNLPVSVEVRPESFARTYALPRGTLKEIVFASIDRAGGLVHYRATVPLRLMVRFRADLRWMWPYDANALGNLYYGIDRGLNALHVRDSSGTFSCLFGADLRPRVMLAGHFARVEWGKEELSGLPTDLNQVAYGAEFELGPHSQNVLNFSFVGTNEGTQTALGDYRALLASPDKAHQAMVRHYTSLLAHSLSIVSPDEEFNRLWSWALVGADRFVTRTPGLGTGLLAGFSTVNRGWDGAQKISGRPGYAWYFGRDGAWSSFALDGYGDFASVRSQLELYQAFQDASGKIYHELTTSGVVHFDAADATPLYVILAGHYLRASGDTEFIRKSWPSLQRAMDFLYSTDTDGDGLIENTDVGHGWMEPGGSIFGAHSEMHLSVLWAQALAEAATLADIVRQEHLRSRYSADAERVRQILNGPFWNPATKFYHYGKMIDGTFRPERTALAAAGALFGMLDDVKSNQVLEILAGNGFSTNWGVRIVSAESPVYNPRSYQEGSVWPLMTGWTALGEYTYGRSAQAFSHLMNTMLIKNLWSLGFVQEVMHGAVNRPAGVCPHQCWSETNILHPAIEGLIGWKPDAPHGTVTLSPRFPLHWDSVTVSNLRMGQTLLMFTMIRSLRTTRYEVRRIGGPPCEVRLAPEIPLSMEITAIKANGRPISFDRTTFRSLLRTPVSVTVNKSVSVVLEHTGGIGMIPLVHHPAPGDSAPGARIISADLQDGAYVVTVEGRQGTTAVFPITFFDHALPSVQGAQIRPGARRGRAELLVVFDRSASAVQRKTVTLALR
jgi:glycogen debranching enzyme